jgi:ubiquinone/menaquinone biosynthesis C-methylase UbiE
MNPQEYTNLARVESTHWYYAGKRELVRRWIVRSLGKTRRLRVLDCGAGTGCFAAEMSAAHEVHVLDDHEDSLRILREKFPAAQVHALGSEGMPFQAGQFDLVTMLDVLEHIREDGAALKEVARVVKPGGYVVVTVPASMALWSDWDVALHHYRRYDRPSLRQLFEQCGELEICHLNYTNTLVFPLVWLVRKLRFLSTQKRGEDYLPPGWINSCLRRLFVWTGLIRFPMPWGVSLLLVARKR